MVLYGCCSIERKLPQHPSINPSIHSFILLFKCMYLCSDLIYKFIYMFWLDISPTRTHSKSSLSRHLFLLTVQFRSLWQIRHSFTDDVFYLWPKMWAGRNLFQFDSWENNGTFPALPPAPDLKPQMPLPSPPKVWSHPQTSAGTKKGNETQVMTKNMKFVIMLQWLQNSFSSCPLLSPTILHVWLNYWRALEHLLQIFIAFHTKLLFLWNTIIINWRTKVSL